ncbi:MAG: Flp family type IVb pilin [Acidimicrobiia bacterium]
MIQSLISRISGLITRATRSDRGASMVEYSLLVILIAIVAFVAVQTVGDTVSGAYSGVADSFTNPN